jgi:hypothetical protein
MENNVTDEGDKLVLFINIAKREKHLISAAIRCNAGTPHVTVCIYTTVQKTPAII